MWRYIGSRGEETGKVSWGQTMEPRCAKVPRKKSYFHINRENTLRTLEHMHDIIPGGTQTHRSQTEVNIQMFYFLLGTMLYYNFKINLFSINRACSALVCYKNHPFYCFMTTDLCIYVTYLSIQITWGFNV